ncbi:MAG: DegQ family serine endoprotease [Gammaproteobacteria bacterium]|nr:DegQ family serine endoprotease [Gammaproteobacteria bacterium]MBI5614665.1 DegQ family serine endoprotease [Gammaproteobacteria bacterium]
MLKKKLIAAAIVAALAGGGAGIPVVQAVAAAETGSAASYGLPDFSPLVEQAGPAVVSVRVTSHPTHTAFRGNSPGIDRDDPLYEFFRRFGQPGPRGHGGEGPTQQGQGSGFIVRADGYILTNAHVVSGADDVQVDLADKRSMKAKVVGVDEKSDVAVLKVDAKNLPTLKIGESSKLKVGEWVIAIGSPFGLDHTVSAGVVSAKSRTLPGDSYVSFIQTDVAINPGNSGGPLINLRGEVVGMNSQIFSNSGGFMGLSFAIPIDVAMNIEDQLLQHGKVTRGRLGVAVQNLSSELAQSFGLDRAQGALVSDVQAGSPAAAAGVKRGDVILKVNGRDIDDAIQLSQLVAETKPGAKAEVELLRDGDHKTLSVAIGEAEGAKLAANDAGGAQAAPGRLGVVVSPLTNEQRRELDTNGGVLVEEAAGAAADAGIRPGDVILAVNAQPVSDPKELAALISKAKDHVAVLVRRDDAEVYVPVKLG